MSDYNDGLLPEPCMRLNCGFGQEYASVELGDGTGYVRVTDDLRGEYHKMQRWYDDELRAALDENAKLREERNHWHVEQVHAYGNWEDTYKRAVELESENAKLRELVRDMWQFEQMSCSKCVAKNDGYCGIGIDEGCPLEHSIYDRMRELGVDKEEDDG